MKKKILVQLPNNEEKIVLSFPFLTELYLAYGDEEIHLIIAEEKSEILKFLPKKFLTHHLPEDKRSILGIHHFVYNLKDVFNVDIFFDLEETLKSAFLGFNFRSKERIGFDNGLNKLLLNETVQVSKNVSFDIRALELLKKKLNINFEQRKYSPHEYIKTVEGIAKVSNHIASDFVVCVMDAKRVNKNFEVFNEIFLGLENIRIKMSFWGEEDSNLTIDQEIINKIELWPVRDTINRIVYGEYGQFIKYLFLSKGLITDIPWLGQMAAYFGISSFVYKESKKEGEFSVLQSLTFTAWPSFFKKENNSIKLYDGDEKKEISFQEFLDAINFKFNL